jgi:hypothetical protein
MGICTGIYNNLKATILRDVEKSLHKSIPQIYTAKCKTKSDGFTTDCKRTPNPKLQFGIRNSEFGIQPSPELRSRSVSSGETPNLNSEFGIRNSEFNPAPNSVRVASPLEKPQTSIRNSEFGIPITPNPQPLPNSELRTPNSELRTPNSELRILI